MNTGAPPRLQSIRTCLEGAVPASMATASPDGIPNLAYLTQVQYVDPQHVALSYQFFNKTRQNLMANPYALLTVIDPVTMAQYRLSLEYLRTETEGPLFETMKAKLAGIASHTGMSGVFRLLGSDVFKVHAIEQVPGDTLPPAPPACNLLAALRASSEQLAACTDLDSLLAQTLACLEQHFGIMQSMILVADPASSRLYTVASRGYAQSGVGSEIGPGEGIIGVAARERTPIRIGHMNAEYAYSRAVKASAAQGDPALALATEIPLPGAVDSRSQMAVPVCAGQRLLAVLYVESQQELRFSYDEEDAVVALASHLASAMQGMQSAPEAEEQPAPSLPASPAARQAALTIRRFRENDSVFLDNDYLIKGVAGSIFWNLMRDYAESRRTEFSNRELRLDSRIRLPDVSDNLEARLLLLSRRLDERAAAIRIARTGRGRFSLKVDCPVRLAEE